jgi:hypothetical protein
MRRGLRHQSRSELIDMHVKTLVCRHSKPHVQGSRQRKGDSMDDNHDNARERFFAAIRVLATSPNTIQTRLVDASAIILPVAIDEFKGDAELRIRFARILDVLAVDQDDTEVVAQETTAHMTDLEAITAAHLICDFYYDLEG